MVQAREEGLIDGIGISNVSGRHLLRAAEQTDIVCAQNLFNLTDRQSLDVLRECETRDIAFVPFCPLGWPVPYHSSAARVASNTARSGSCWLNLACIALRITACLHR